MKVFLRNTQTGWYYQGASQWTPEQAAALDLRQVTRAVERIFESHLQNVEILLCYDDPRYDLVLPVPASPSRGPASDSREASDEDQQAETRKAAHRHKRPHRL